MNNWYNWMQPVLIEKEQQQQSWYFPEPWLDSKPNWNEQVYAMASILPFISAKLYCHQRGNFLVQQLASLVFYWWSQLRHHYAMDLVTSAYYSLAKLSFEIVLQLYIEKQPLIYHQASEKLKPFYDNLLRQYHHGGFMYSSQMALHQGEPLFPSSMSPTSKAKTVLELDLVSAYGSSGSRLTTGPGGFAKAFNTTTKKIIWCLAMHFSVIVRLNSKWFMAFYMFYNNNNAGKFGQCFTTFLNLD